MKNTKRIGDLLQILQSIDDQWEIKFLDEQQETEEELNRKISQLLGILRQELKTEEPEAVQEVLQSMGIKEAPAVKLIEKGMEMLWFYQKLSVLRELEDKDDKALKGLLSTVYNMSVVRFEPGYLDRLANEKYGKETLLDVSACVANLTDYYVARSYTRRGIVKDLEDESGLSSENCEYWAELIEQNFLVLKMNYIISELQEMKKLLKSKG